MDESKQEVIQWLDKLESYAIENEFSSRFIDNICECKNDLCSENVQIGAICTQIEELLQSMEKKVCPNLSNPADQERDEVLQQMELQVKKMVQRCHDENLQAMDELDVCKQSLLNKCSMQMHDMVKSATYVEDIESEARYLQFYENVAHEYEKACVSVASEMLENMNQNYSHMVEHMSGLVQNANSAGIRLINGKNLYELNNKRTTLGEKILSEVQVGNTGKEKIRSFAQKTGKQIGKIVKGAELKRKICAMLPVLILLGIILVNVISGFFMSPTEPKATDASIEVGDAMDVFDWFQNLFGLQEILTTLNVVGMSAIFVGIAVVLIVVVFYIGYIKCLKKSCHNVVCKKSAAYLEKELLAFEQSGCMRQALEEEIQNAAEEYELRNVTLLNDTFSFEERNMRVDKTNAFTALAEEWKRIKSEQRMR